MLQKSISFSIMAFLLYGVYTETGKWTTIALSFIFLLLYLVMKVLKIFMDQRKAGIDKKGEGFEKNLMFPTF